LCVWCMVIRSCSQSKRIFIFCTELFLSLIACVYEDNFVIQEFHDLLRASSNILRPKSLYRLVKLDHSGNYELHLSWIQFQIKFADCQEKNRAVMLIIFTFGIPFILTVKPDRSTKLFYRLEVTKRNSWCNKLFMAAKLSDSMNVVICTSIVMISLGLTFIRSVL